MKLTFKKRTSVRSRTRAKNKARIRKKVTGTTERPRLAVFRSGRHFYAQIIDDSQAKTLVAASTAKLGLSSPSNCEAAKAVGQEVAKKALEKNIDNVVFDRSGYVYHGRVAAAAAGARESGLKF